MIRGWVFAGAGLGVAFLILFSVKNFLVPALKSSDPSEVILYMEVAMFFVCVSSYVSVEIIRFWGYVSKFTEGKSPHAHFDSRSMFSLLSAMAGSCLIYVTALWALHLF